ncbi:hypothetical protein HGRIS_013636 [Hohenbuehelia grisea]|uniref:PIN-like protein n=1 Tax=Hohenbuehelia grisea TaxID=104357 RepID=A0ABR3IVY7_9AGAR
MSVYSNVGDDEHHRSGAVQWYIGPESFRGLYFSFHSRIYGESHPYSAREAKLCFEITLFPCGGHRWVAMDYVGPGKENEEVREMMRLRRRRSLLGWMRLTSLSQRKPLTQKEPRDAEETYNDKESPQLSRALTNPMSCGTQQGPSHMDVTLLRTESADHEVSSVEPADEAISRTTSSAPTEFVPSRTTSPITAVGSDWKQPNGLFNEELRPQPVRLALTGSCPPTEHVGLTPGSLTSSSRRGSTIWARIVTFVRSLCAPVSLAMVIAFPIAAIPQLKALFVDVPEASLPPAPDGQPPLAVIIDAATFIGGASVPLGLICLGSALAKLQIPRHQWSTLPLGAIWWLAIGKLVIMPVLGVLIVHGLVKASMIGKEDKLLQFVCMFFSCLPTATTQVFLTQVYSSTGTAEHLSVFLVPQYIITFFSITGMTAYCLSTLF